LNWGKLWQQSYPLTGPKAKFLRRGMGIARRKPKAAHALAGAHAPLSALDGEAGD
jgi:hypothetical protein